MQLLPACIAAFALCLCEFENLSITPGERLINLPHSKVHELPRPISLWFGKFIQPIPFFVQLGRKLLFVVSRFLAHIEFERCNYFFLRRIVASKSIHKSLDASLG